MNRLTPAVIFVTTWSSVDSNNSEQITIFSVFSSVSEFPLTGQPCKYDISLFIPRLGAPGGAYAA